MHLENLEGIKKPIESEDPKEKREKLYEKIGQISLVYADKKFEEIKKEGENHKFSEAIRDFTPIEDIVLGPLFHLEGFRPSEHKEEIKTFLKDFYDEIDILYEKEGFNFETISELVNEKKDVVVNCLGADSLKEVDKKDRKIGTKLVTFNKVNNIQIDSRGRYKNLEKYGFSKSDKFTEVHVDNFYNSGEKNVSQDLIKNDFGKVAEYLVDENPATAAVVGTSWLLNTPIAQRLGFKMIEDSNGEQGQFTFWFQFIDKDGQINQKRFNEFMKTGEPPFKVVKAYIPTEEFLRRYLPDNRKGKIILKEINRDREDFWVRVGKLSKILMVTWTGLLKGMGNFNNEIVNNETFNELLDLLGSDSKIKYMDFFREMYDKKIPWSQVSERKSEEIKEIDKKIDKIKEKDLYKDKEIIIE
jgi:hypothetical protein